MSLKRIGDLVLYFKDRAGVVLLHQKEVIDLLSRSTNEWRRGFRTIGELTCRDRIAANMSLKRIGESVHCLKRRRGLVASHQKENIERTSSICCQDQCTTGGEAFE